MCHFFPSPIPKIPAANCHAKARDLTGARVAVSRRILRSAGRRTHVSHRVWPFLDQIRQSIARRHVQCSSPEPDSADNKSTAHQQRPPNGADDRRLTGRSAGTRHSRGRLTATADSPNGTRCTMEVEHLIGPLLGDNIRRPNDTNEQKRGESQSSFGHKSNRSAQRTRVRIDAPKEKYLAAKEIRRRQPRKKLCAKSGVNQHRKEM